MARLADRVLGAVIRGALWPFDRLDAGLYRVEQWWTRRARAELARVRLAAEIRSLCAHEEPGPCELCEETARRAEG